MIMRLQKYKHPALVSLALVTLLASSASAKGLSRQNPVPQSETSASSEEDSESTSRFSAFKNFFKRSEAQKENEPANLDPQPAPSPVTRPAPSPVTRPASSPVTRPASSPANEGGNVGQANNPAGVTPTPVVAPLSRQVDTAVASNSPQGVLEKIAYQKSIADTEKQREGLALFERGMQMYREFKFEDALTTFERARNLIPENEDLRDYIARARYVLNDGREGHIRTESNWMGEGKMVQEGEHLLKIEYHIRQGEAIVAKANEEWNAAPDITGADTKPRALQTLAHARTQYSQALDAVRFIGIGTDTTQQREVIMGAISQIDVVEAGWGVVMEERRKVQAHEQAKQLAAEQTEYENKKYERLMSQARKDFLNGQYFKAEELCRRILETWPENKPAKKLLGKSVRLGDKHNIKKIKEKNDEEWKRNMEKIKEASISFSQELVYPDNWDKIRERKPQSVRKVEDPEWKKNLTRKMNLPVTLILVGNNLDEAIEILHEQTGINLVVDRGLFLEDARIESLRLQEVRFSSALNWMLDSIPSEDKLVYVLRDGAVFITSRDRVALIDRPEQILYDVTDLITTFQDFALADGAGLLISGVQGPSVVGEVEDQEALGSDALIELVKQTVDPESWEAGESGVGIVEYEIGKLLISQTQDNHKQIEELLEKLRKLQTLQISIETRFIVSQEDDLLDLGVEWKGFNEVPIEKLGDNDGSGVYSSRGNFETDTRVASVLGSAGSGVVKGNRFVEGNAAGRGGIFQISVLDPIRASLVLHALTEKKKLKDILSPRLTVLNNHQGYIVRAIDTSYISNYENTEGNLIPIIERISSGELLVVRPTASSDKKYIMMDLSPQISRQVQLVERVLNIAVDLDAEGDVDAAIAEVVPGVIELPDLQVWQLQTRVQIPDGGVVFVGGRMGNKETKITRGVPVISKIPLLGRLFRTDADASELDNLLISVRGKILLFEEFEAKL